MKSEDVLQSIAINKFSREKNTKIILTANLNAEFETIEQAALFAKVLANFIDSQ